MTHTPRGVRLMGRAFLLFLLATAQALAADITAVRSWRAPDNTRLVFDLSGPVKFQVSPDSSPARLVVDIEGARPAGPLALPAAQAPLKAIRLEATPGGQRLVIETGAELMPKIFQLPPNEKYGHRLVLDLYERNAPRPVAPSTGAVATALPAGPVAVAVPAGAPAPGSARPADATRPAGADKAGADKAATERAAADKAAGVAIPPSASPAPAGPQAPASAGTPTGPATAPVAAVPTPATGTTPGTATATTGSAKPAEPGKAPRPAAGDSAARPAPPEPAAEPARAEAAKYDARRYRNIIVAVDAGHGGEDPGAIGQKGTHEKDVTLAIARELVARLEAEPGITAVLTRSGDYFIPLQDRRRIARYQHKADIFVSVHADSAPSPAARGASVFALSLKGADTATSRFARMLAERENRADLIGGAAIETEDNVLRNVLADMVVAGSLDHSLHMGRNILGGLERLGNLHSHRVEQAGFAVLKEPGMVSLLVETGFISNPDEEKKLTSRQHQQDIAAAIAAGVRRYCVQYPAPATYFAWLAERGRAVAADKPARRNRDALAAPGASAADTAPAGEATPAPVLVALNTSRPEGDTPRARPEPGPRNDARAPETAAKAVAALAHDSGARADTARKEKDKPDTVRRYRMHKVGPGESLTRLSDRYGVSMARLRETNALRDDSLRIGQTLKIPRD